MFTHTQFGLGRVARLKSLKLPIEKLKEKIRNENQFTSERSAYD